MSHDDEVSAVRASLVGRPRDTYPRREQFPSKPTVDAAVRVSEALERLQGGDESARPEFLRARVELRARVRSDRERMVARARARWGS